MSTNPNPLRVLGLSPGLVKGLRGENLMEVVRSMYRTLQKIHHPDRGGDGKISTRLNWAMEELKDLKKLHKWREKFLNSSRTEKLLEELEHLYEEYEVWWQKYHLPQLKALCLNSQHVFIDILGIRQEPLWVRQYKPDPIFEWFKMPAETKEQKARRDKARQESPVANLIRFRVEDDQLMTEDYKGEVLKIERLPIGVIVAHDVQRHTGFKHNSVPKMMLEILKRHQDRYQLRLVGEKIDDTELRTGIPDDIFKEVLYLVRPNPNQRGFLISTEISGDQLSFHLEGETVSPDQVEKAFDDYRSCGT